MKLSRLYRKYPNCICIVRVSRWDSVTGIAKSYDLLGTVKTVSELKDVLDEYDEDAVAISTYEDGSEELPPNIVAKFFRYYFYGGKNYEN